MIPILMTCALLASVYVGGALASAGNWLHRHYRYGVRQSEDYYYVKIAGEVVKISDGAAHRLAVAHGLAWPRRLLAAWRAGKPEVENLYRKETRTDV